MRLYRLLLLLAWLIAGPAVAEGLAVIAHPTVPRVDLQTLQRIYSGKVIEVNAVRVIPYNAAPGTAERNRFLREYLQQDEEKYTAYWTVRRYIGKGTPPQEATTLADMIRNVQSTPGAIGYIPESEIKPGLTILLRRP